MSTVAFSYIRMSTDLQLKGDSLRRQEEASKAYAERNGLILDNTLTDIGISAFEGRNARDGALAKFLQRVENGQIEPGSVLILESLDRLSRNKVRLAMPLFLSIVNAGIRIVTLSDNERSYDAASLDKDPYGLLMSLVVMARANEESETKRDRISKAYAAARVKARQDKTAIWGNYPAWITRNEDGKLALNDFAETVKLIFKLADEGMAGNTLVRYLNSKPEIKMPSTAKNGWYTAYVGRILRSRAVLGEHQPSVLMAGKRVPDGDPIQGYFPAVIEDHDLWQRVQDRRDGVKVARKPKTGSNNLFSGRCNCSHCRGPMNIHYASGRPFLICSARIRGLACDVPGMISYTTLEPAILDTVKEWRLSELLKAADNPQDQVAAVDLQLADARSNVARLEKEADNLVAAIGAQGHARLMTRLSAVESKIEVEKAKLRELKAQRRAVGGSRDRKLDVAQRATALIKEAQEATGPDRLAARVKLSAALAEFITDVECDSKAKTVTVIILNGLAAYNFKFIRDGKYQRWIADGSMNLVDQVKAGLISTDVFRPWKTAGRGKAVVPGFDSQMERVEKMLDQ